MPRFRRFLFSLSIVFGILRLCYVEDAQRESVAKAVNEPINTDAQQDNVVRFTESENNDVKMSESATPSSSPSAASSSTVSMLSSLSSSSVDELANVISSVVGISSSELDQLILPTVAPATPQFDIETVSASLPLHASNTEAVLQEQPKQYHEKSLQDLTSNLELSAIDEVGLKKEDQKEAKGEEQGAVGSREKKEDPLSQDNESNAKSPVVFLPPVDGKKDEKEIETQTKVNDSKVLILKEDKNLEEKNTEEKQEYMTKTKDKDEKEIEESKKLNDEAQQGKQAETQAKGYEQPDKQQEREVEKEQDQTHEEILEKDEEKHKQKQEKKEKIKDDREPKQEVKKESSVLTPTADDKDEDSFTAKLKQAEQETNAPSEDMPSFDEFKRQLQQEEEKQKSIMKRQKDEQTVPSGTQIKSKPKKIKERKQNNYASVDCGAKILSTNPEATNAFSILQDNRDIYMLNPCSAKIWFIVELCDTAQVRRIDIANFELFSSTPESFRVFVSGRYPTRDWTLLGTFQARDERTLQSFPLEEPIYAKYFKVEMLSHFGKEHYCPISLFRVFGTSMMEELEDHEAGGQDDSDSVDPDDELVTVLPHDPSAKLEDKTKEPNILATVGDTLMNMVKHAAERLTGVIKDTKGNDTNDKDTIVISTVAPSSSIVSSMVFKQQLNQTKPGIVTLIPSEDEDENQKLNQTLSEIVNATNKTQEQSPDEPDKIPKNESSSFYDKIDLESDKGSKSTASFTSCKMLVRMLGHSGFGCLMGGVLYSKRAKQQGFTPKERTSKAKQNIRVNDQIGASVDVSKSDTKASKDEDSKETKEEEGEKKNEKAEENKKENKRKITYEEQPIENKSKENKQGNTDMLSNKEALETSSDETKGAQAQEEIKATPSVNSTSVHPPTMIEPSGSQPSLKQPADSKTEPTPSLGTASLLRIKPSQEASQAPTSRLKIPDSKPTREQVKKSEDKSSTRPSESLPSLTESIQEAGPQYHTSKGDNAVKAESSKSEVTDSKELSTSSAEDSSVETKGSCTTVHSNEHSLVQPLQPTTPSKCVAPTVTSNLKDVDVLEFKLLDSTGREGTAHPEKPVNQDKPAESVKPETPDKVKEQEDKDREGEKQDKKKDSESVSDKEKTPIEISKTDESSASSVSVVEASKAEPQALISTPASDQPKEPPTTPPPIKAPVEDSVKPLPPPPVMSDSSVDPSRNIEVSLADEVSKPSISAINQGLPSSGAQKESIFMRLTNRIKALEQNLTLSTLYMEKLNQKYRRIVEDMQKNFDKKVNLLTNATIKAENVIKSQKEQIAELQAKVDETKGEMEHFSKKLTNLNKDVMERHIIGLFLEVIFIVMLFIVFRRWDKARLRRDIMWDSFKNGTVPASRGFTTYPEARKTMLLKGQLSAREQLHRSFSTPVGPVTIGAVSHDLSNKHKDDNCPSFDAKKKRSRKRPKSAILGNDSLSSSKSVPELTNQGSVVNTAAGLLFSPARGLLNGLTDSWRFTRSNSLDDSQIHRKSVNGLSSSDRLQKAKSLDIIQENTERQPAPSINKKGRIPTPPPPPPPKPSGMTQKRLPGQLPSNLVNRRGGLHGKYHFTS